jgi:ribosomal protein L9
MKTFRTRALAVSAAALALAGGSAAVAQSDAEAKGRKGAKVAVRANLASNALQARTLRVAAQHFGIQRRDLNRTLPGTSLAALAPTHGKTAESLKQAVLASIATQLDKRIANGRLTAEQKQAQLTAAGTRIDKILARVWPDPLLRSLSRLVPVTTMNQAAKFFGVNRRDLRTQANGKSLNALATEQGKDPAGLKAAILARFDARLDRLVANQRTTQARADAVLAQLGARIDTALARIR